MVKFSNIVCKTIGLAGMSAVVYDAYATAKHHSMVGAEEASADIFEKSVAASRSTTTESHLTGAMQRKVSDLRMQNPIIPIFGKITGFVKGFINGLGDNIVPVLCSSVALAGKGKWQKGGAWGLGIYGLLQVAKEGFGLGKNSAVDE